jgi:hypothetical protein
MEDGAIEEFPGLFATIFIKIAPWSSQKCSFLSSMAFQDKSISWIGSHSSLMHFGLVGLAWQTSHLTKMQINTYQLITPNCNAIMSIFYNFKYIFKNYFHPFYLIIYFITFFLFIFIRYLAGPLNYYFNLKNFWIWIL